MMLDSMSSLFSKTSAHALSQNAIMETTQYIKRLSDEEILNQSDEDLIAQAANRCTYEVPAIRRSDIYADEIEVERTFEGDSWDVFSDRRGGSCTVKQHIIEFHVPFDGDRNLFTVQPSRRTMPGPQAIVGADELVIPIETASKTADQIKAELERQLTSINEHLMTLERDLASARPTMDNFARSYVPSRRAEILRNKGLAASLGFPLKRRPTASETYKPPEVRRKIRSIPPSIKAPFKPEPALDEAEYQHILSVMDNMIKVMERSPHTFVDMDEENIRQHFLVQLNGQYEGQATGETFNFKGKTDILIRSGDRNVFIAECKIW